MTRDSGSDDMGAPQGGLVPSQAATATTGQHPRLHIREDSQNLSYLAEGLSLRAVIGALNDGVTVLAPDGTMIFANEAAARLTGLPDADSLVRTKTATIWTRYELLDENDRPLDGMTPSRRVLNGEPAAQAILKYRERATGVVFWSRVESKAVTDGSGKLICVVTSIQDVTPQKQAEQDLHDAHDWFDFLVEATQILSSSMDYRSTLMQVARLTVPRLSDWGSLHLTVGNDPETLTAEQIGVFHSDPEMVKFAQYYNERWPADPDLPGGLHEIIRTGKSVLYEDMPEEFVLAACVDDEHREATRKIGFRSAMAVPIMRRGRCLGMFSFVRGPGARRYTHKDLQLAEDLAQRCAKFVDNALLYEQMQQELHNRRQVERELAEEKERLSVTLESIGDGVIATDAQQRITLFNPIAAALCGWTAAEALGRPVSEVFHIINQKTGKKQVSPIDQVLAEGKIVGLANHTALIARDGTQRVIADSGAPIRGRDGAINGAVLVFRDVTHKERIDSELQRTAKLESVGVLAGGIAHDFNNILTAILANLSLARASTDEQSSIGRLLEEGEKATLRARDLTQQLLTFAKGGAPIRKMTSVGQLVKESALFALSGSNVRTVFELARDLWPAEVDSGQISQVVQNLVLNAWQAMPEGGVVEISAENVQVSAETGLPLADGAYVRVQVRDQGVGIAPELLPRIFDPFYTTKPRGTGLGLATSHAIIHKHDGYITAHSQPSLGTAVTFYLPATPRRQVLDFQVAVERAPGFARILVVDDEAIIRRTVAAVLQSSGYEVVCVSDGSEAVTEYRAALIAQRRFDAVILDLTVPGGMGGQVAVKKLLEVDPHVKAIVSSGYSADPVMAEFATYGFCGVVAKPYTATELRGVLTAVLGDSGTGKDA